jgi:uncharacterized protein YyaL (SSP411 family)
MLSAADRYLGEQVDVVVAETAATTADALALREAAVTPYVPDLVITGVMEGDAREAWPLYVGKSSGEGATAFACRGYACLEPTRDLARLGAQVTELGNGVSRPGS